MRPHLRLALVLLLVPLLFISCQDDDSDVPELNIPKIKPTVVANAGPDQTIYLPQNAVSLNGSQSTVTNGRIESYAWNMVNGPFTFQLDAPTAAQTTARNLNIGKYHFELTVTAVGGASAKDTVIVIVNAEPTYEHWTKLGIFPGSGFNYDNNVWFGGTNILMGIGEQAFAVSFIGKVYQLSGTNTWQEKGEFPELMERPPLVFSIQNRGYCLWRANLWQYNPEQNTWLRKKEVPAPIRDAQVALALQDRVYLVSATMGRVMSYDPVTDTYSPEKDFPVTGIITGFAVNGKGYCVEQEGTCWELDSATGTWQQRASLPHSINRMTGFSLRNHGYVISDLNNAAYNESKPMKVWQYDPVADQWKEFEEPYPGWGVNDLQAASLGERVIVGLGYNNGDFPATDLWQFE